MSDTDRLAALLREAWNTWDGENGQPDDPFDWQAARLIAAGVTLAPGTMLTPDRLAAAMNDAQIGSTEIALGRDLRAVAVRILDALGVTLAPQPAGCRLPHGLHEDCTHEDGPCYACGHLCHYVIDEDGTYRGITPIEPTLAPQPDTASRELRAAARALVAATDTLSEWDEHHGYIVNSARDRLDHDVDAAWDALRAALAAEPQP